MSGSEVGSYLRLIDLYVYPSTVGLRSIKKNTDVAPRDTFEAKCRALRIAPVISSGPVFMINSRVQAKLVHTWIIIVVVKPQLVQMSRMDGPAEYLS